MSNAAQSASPSIAATSNPEKSSSPELAHVAKISQTMAGLSRHTQVTHQVVQQAYTIPESPHLDAFSPSYSAPNIMESAGMPPPTYTPLVDTFQGFDPSSTWQDFRDYQGDYQSSYASSSYAPSAVYSDHVGPDYEPNPVGVSGGFSQETRQAVNQHLNALFSEELFDKFFTAPLEDSAGHTAASSNSVPVPEAQDAYCVNTSQFPFSTNQQVEPQPFMASVMPQDLETIQFYDRLFEVPDMSTIPHALPSGVMAPPPIPHPAVEPAAIPYPYELQNYSEGLHFCCVLAARADRLHPQCIYSTTCSWPRCQSCTLRRSRSRESLRSCCLPCRPVGRCM